MRDWGWSGGVFPCPHRCFTAAHSYMSKSDLQVCDLAPQRRNRSLVAQQSPHSKLGFVSSPCALLIWFRTLPSFLRLDT